MQLNQYYTEDMYGDILVSNLSLPSPKIALDLGFGTGNLLHAAKRRWNNLSLIGVDIDKDHITHAKAHTAIAAIEHNGFDPSLPDRILDRFGEIDLLLGNPPFFSSSLDQKSKMILQASGMLDCISKQTKKIPAELIFIAQNLRLLSKEGELGLIVPAGIISGERWKPIREFLFSNYTISNVIQLPTDSFKNTDAQTFILTIKHKLEKINGITLSHINNTESLKIKPEEAFIRADYDYYQKTLDMGTALNITLNDFQLYRGNKSHNILDNIAKKHLHTTTMPKLPIKQSFNNTSLDGAKNTLSGDILISRVGRRCLGRAIYVERGSVPISDCIIGIRPRTKNAGNLIWKKLSSPSCKDYFSRVSLGVGAKYITYKTITDYLTSNDHAAT